MNIRVNIKYSEEIIDSIHSVVMKDFGLSIISFGYVPCTRKIVIQPFQLVYQWNIGKYIGLCRTSSQLYLSCEYFIHHPIADVGFI